MKRPSAHSAGEVRMIAAAQRALAADDRLAASIALTNGDMLRAASLLDQAKKRETEADFQESALDQAAIHG